MTSSACLSRAAVLAAFAFVSSSCFATDLYVDPTGATSGAYKTVQAAINSSTEAARYTLSNIFGPASYWGSYSNWGTYVAWDPVAALNAVPNL